MKKYSILSAGIILFLHFTACDKQAVPDQKSTHPVQTQGNAVTPSKTPKNTNTDFQRAFEQKHSGIMLEGVGTITALLKDDTKGSRHQRFIVTLTSGQSLLIAHNIDLAPRINHLKKGENIAFYGQYEWNKKGGTIHWTHIDPQGRHANGWLRYRGKMYQ